MSCSHSSIASDSRGRLGRGDRGLFVSRDRRIGRVSSSRASSLGARLVDCQERDGAAAVFAVLAIGLFGVLLFGIYPFNTMGDDIRMFKDSGVTLIMVLGMLQAVWSAGTSVSVKSKEEQR